MNFEEFKKTILERAKNANACKSEYERAERATTIEELIDVLKDNMSFARDNEILTIELSKQFERPELFNIGKENTGFFNSGDRNSGDRNSGDLNSGYRNSGDLNSGYLNSGYRNSGDLNSGYLNSGYRNSGVFCNRKKEDKAIIFNKESNLTWNDWYNHDAYRLSSNLTITKWIDWGEMTEEEKKENPKAFVCEGYLKVYEYKEAWANLWATFSETSKNVFKTLPNFDAEVFEDITGIKI